MANKLRVSKSGSGVPTAITPDFLGQIYIDEDTGTRYEATALTEGSWVDKLSLKEDTANKKTSLTDNSDIYYPTQKAVKTAVDAKQDALTFGIANTNAVKIDDAFVADNDYAKFTANGIEGVPYSTVLSDIGAQAALGYTPENVANKETTALDTSTTKYPCNNVVKEAVDAKQDSLGYIAENVANKKTTITSSDTDYPTCKAVETGLAAKQASLGYTAEDVDNKVTSFQETPDDNHYPSEKLVKDSLDAKLAITNKATSSDINTGTDDAKYVTSKSLRDSGYNKLGGITTSTATPEPEYGRRSNEYCITALATAATFAAPALSIFGGTLVNGDSLLIRIKDNGTARALSWNAIYRAIGVVLPTTTVANKTIYIGCKYNSADNKWDVLAVGQEA